MQLSGQLSGQTVPPFSFRFEPINIELSKGFKDRQQSSGLFLQWACTSLIQSHILSCISNNNTQNKCQIFKEYDDRFKKKNHISTSEITTL